MGSSKQHGSNSKVAVVSVTTDLLKDKLNRVYSRFHANSRSMSHEGLFEYLWDLKEVALVEGKQSVELPTSWLEDLETELESPTRTH